MSGVNYIYIRPSHVEAAAKNASIFPMAICRLAGIESAALSFVSFLSAMQSSQCDSVQPTELL